MSEFPYAEFGYKLKQRRRSLSPPVTQRDLAKMVGVSSGFIAHIEQEGLCLV